MPSCFAAAIGRPRYFHPYHRLWNRCTGASNRPSTHTGSSIPGACILIFEEQIDANLFALGAASTRPLRIAFQSPCSLQHGQKLGGVTESLLCRLGFQLIPVAEAHLCCGSAGTYSILQRRLARQLLKHKINNLEAGHPDLIATANIGCYSFLQQEAHVPVKHWIELLDTSVT